LPGFTLGERRLIAGALSLSLLLALLPGLLLAIAFAARLRAVAGLTLAGLATGLFPGLAGLRLLAAGALRWIAAWRSAISRSGG
jgi:hypothetical protein